MNDFELIICEEQIYAQRLSDYISTKLNLDNISIYSDDNSLMKEIENYDTSKAILLIANIKYRYLADIKSDENTEIIFLDDSINFSNGIDRVYKFQSAGALFTDIYSKSKLLRNQSDVSAMDVRMLTRNDNCEENINRGDKKIYGVYSPEGKMCKTSFAIALGEMLSEREKTLYLNIEGYSGMFFKERKKNNCYTVANLIYDYVSDKDRCAINLSKNIVERNGLHYIYPSGLMELLEIEPHLWEELISFILSETSYKNLIVELGNCIRGIDKIMKNCSVVYVPINGRKSEERSQKSEEFVCECDVHDILLYPGGNLREVYIPNISDINMTGYGIRSRQLMNYIDKEGLLLT